MKDRTFRVDYLICAVLLFSMAAIAFINVLSRYFLHFSIGATEEITINLFVWMTVVGSGIAFERGAQLGMVTFYNMFGRRMKRSLVVLAALLGAGLFLLVNIYTIQAIYDELTLFHAKSGALGIPVWIYYAGVPAFSFFVFRGLYRGMKTRLETLDVSS